MKPKFVDDFLDKDTFKNLQTKMFNNTFPWFMEQGISDGRGIEKKEYFFTHIIFKDWRINSETFKDVLIILNKLKVKSLLRIKGNLYIKTPTIVKHDLHTDYEFSHKAGLLCMNTNNGYTYFKDGTKIESVENRMITFDAGEEHAGTSCSDENYRCNIIFNYF
tara:strand:- start:58 stop:546 length:489 start_codon:yes stop_codon:yes gene_type:complete